MNQKNVVDKILSKIVKKEMKNLCQLIALSCIYAGTIFAISSTKNTAVILLLLVPLSIEFCLLLALLARALKLKIAWRKANILIEK